MDKESRIQIIIPKDKVDKLKIYCIKHSTTISNVLREYIIKLVK